MVGVIFDKERMDIISLFCSGSIDDILDFDKYVLCVNSLEHSRALNNIMSNMGFNHLYFMYRRKVVSDFLGDGVYHIMSTMFKKVKN